MSHVFELLVDGGDAPDTHSIPLRPMLVRLYPQSSDERPACEADGIVTESIRNAGEQLLEYGAIDYYAIYRYPLERSIFEAPGDHLEWEDISREFKRFLQGETGIDENLYAYRGVHQLIHGEATGCTETADGYAPQGAGGEYSDLSAFAGGVVTWSPVCTDDGLTRNAAIQETVHSFLHPDVYDEELTGEGHDEHTLGRVDDEGRTTPLLTYHWDDDIDQRGGECPSAQGAATGYTQVLTECTKAGVAQTAAAKAGGVNE